MRATSARSKRQLKTSAEPGPLLKHSESGSACVRPTLMVAHFAVLCTKCFELYNFLVNENCN